MVKVGSTPSGAARYIRYGLCAGASDIIGIVKPTGRFLALEVKIGKADATPYQASFIRMVLEMGGYAAVVRSVDDALAAVAEAKGVEP